MVVNFPDPAKGPDPDSDPQHCSWFLAEVSRDQKNVARRYTRLSYMTIKGNNCFSWGPKPDLHVALDEDILLEAVVPEPVTSRGHLGLKKTDLQLVLSLMVVVYFPSLLTYSFPFFVFDLKFFFSKLPYFDLTFLSDYYYSS